MFNSPNYKDLKMFDYLNEKVGTPAYTIGLTSSADGDLTVLTFNGNETNISLALSNAAVRRMILLLEATLSPEVEVDPEIDDRLFIGKYREKI